MSSKIVEIEDMITVGTLAEKLKLPVSKLIAELMKNGVMVTVNERLDFDTAQIIVNELDPELELVKITHESVISPRTKHKTTSKTAQTRPPVVAVMGHVDHGKTSLLDAVRGVQSAKHEAGGITQHISACQVVHNKRKITFLDTPGHEAFMALREHGAQLTDLVIIVVAADDGVKPQTVEAIRFAKKAKVKIIVAINKMDKENADPNHVKQQLAEQDVLVEGWGGDVVVVEVSAKARTGINDLLDMILLVADVEELKADFKVPASGLIIEAHMEKGRGPVAIALVEEGTLHNTDFVVAGTTYAKIRNLESTDGQPVKEATPATPVLITGFKSLPDFGDEFKVAINEKTSKTEASDMIQTRSANTSKANLSSGELLSIINRSNKLNQLNVVVKADVQGSLTSVIDSLKNLDNEEVAIRVVSSGVGGISESDIHQAHTSQAIIYAFRVDVPAAIKQLAHRDSVPIKSYDVIYELLDDAKTELSQLLRPEIVETPLGRLIIKGIFKTTKTEVIAGGEVTKGKLSVPALAKLIRDGEELAEAEVTNLKRGPQDAKEVLEGEMCGINLKTANKLDLKEGDHLELFTRETVTRTI